MQPEVSARNLPPLPNLPPNAMLHADDQVLKPVCGFELYETIGQGSTSVNPHNGEQAAVKIVPKVQKRMDRQALQKEIMIHRSLHHENIIRFLGTNEDQDNVYIVTEYAAAGELFDRIVPDVGVEDDLAHLYFTQLVAGMDYLHEKGISHRDLKPENLLLDECGNLKITDFGLATVFKHKGAVRVLTTPCGTPPYVAPEILTLRYDGAAVDIWSAGIILYVLVAGNTPWAEPVLHDEEYAYYAHNYPSLGYQPWTGFSPPLIGLLRGVLNMDPQRRYNIHQIKANSWFCRPNPMLTDGKCNDPVALAERMISNLTLAGEAIVSSSPELGSSPPIAYSQPEGLIRSEMMDSIGMPNFVSFSQPVRVNSVSTLHADSQMESQSYVPTL
ncbi:Chk1 protein kinase, partial [Quaeritorhiza haematococci]